MIALFTTSTTHHIFFENQIYKKYKNIITICETTSIKPKFKTSIFFEKKRDIFEKKLFFKNKKINFKSKKYKVKNINNNIVLKILKKNNVKYIVVFGTRKIDKMIINKFKNRIFNLHGGNPEEYRGLDSHYWSIYHNNFNLYACLHKLNYKLDDGTELFDASTLAVTTIDTSNLANNVIPAEAKATVNIRFNDAHNSNELTAWLLSVVGAISDDTGIEIDTKVQVSGESFVTPLGKFSDLVSNSVYEETGLHPEASTSGGTSDARFIKDYCPVVEFGLVGKTMHQVDERVSVEQINKLKLIYTRIMKNYFT